MRSGVDVFTVPGYTGSGPRHWQTLWEQLDRDYRRVEQDDWNDPRPDVWVGRLDRAITGSSKPVVLLAHSLGCLTVVHWVARGLAAPRMNLSTSRCGEMRVSAAHVPTVRSPSS